MLLFGLEPEVEPLVEVRFRPDFESLVMEANTCPPEYVAEDSFVQTTASAPVSRIRPIGAVATDLYVSGLQASAALERR